MCAVASKHRTRKAAIRGAERAEFPGFIEFCHPEQRAQPPAGPDWIHEVKADGYRAELVIHAGVIKVHSRRGHDWSKSQFAAVSKAAGFLRDRDLVMDGEVVALNSAGRSDFNLLRRELAKRNSSRLQFHAFDLLYLDGYDLRRCRLDDRKDALRGVLANAPEEIVFVDPFEENGHLVFEQACRFGLEGIVSKRRDAPYRSGEQATWIKVKCKASDSYPIIAFVEKLGAKPRRIASLYIGRRDGDRLVYAGKVRSGYTEAIAREVRERLDPLILPKSPLSHPIKKPKATWVRPEVLAEVEYGSINEGGILREAVFKGLRDDLAPLTPPRNPRVATDLRVRAAHKVGVSRENILQLLPDAVTPSKAELAAYWKRVWKKALPHLGLRPLKLVRRVHGTTFYHKGSLPEIPEAVHQLKVEKREGGTGTRLWVDSLAGLLGLVDIGAVELHPWNATVSDIEHADRLVIDLDPGEGVEWERLVEAAVHMRELLVEEGLQSWPKLTGGKGIHLMAPLAERQTHDRVHAWARRLCAALTERHPKLYILSAQAQRRGRIFLDYLRNGRGTTAIGTYSPRAREGFPIAAPTTWARVESGIHPDCYTMQHPFPRRTSRRRTGRK
jgi:bifunctional non-homologous end joining protein LigD